jgi:small subunit ribosomal protein S6
VSYPPATVVRRAPRRAGARMTWSTPAPPGGRETEGGGDLRNYEILVLVDPEADDAAVGQVVDRVKGIISGQGGEVSSVDVWGRRKLAHEIERNNEGVYFVTAFQAETPAALAELDRALSFADDVMRFKIVRTDAA